MTERGAVVNNPWSSLRRYTPAHVGIGRAGVSLPTSAHLAFQLAHASARDAVHESLEVAAVRADLEQRGVETVALHSAAADRASYLQRPDLGRQLDVPSQQAIDALAVPRSSDPADLAVAVVDGLSCRAIHRHAAAFLSELLARLAESAEPWRLAPVAVVEQGRVAIGDPIGQALRCRVMVVLIGERPGLSSPDSLGAYLTWAPRQGRTDADRNCLSNIRPEGLPYADAAIRLAGLLDEARRRGLSGVGLKDQQVLRHAAVATNVLLDR